MRARNKRILSQRHGTAAVAAEVSHDAAGIVAADVVRCAAGSGCGASGSWDLVFLARHFGWYYLFSVFIIAGKMREGERPR